MKYITTVTRVNALSRRRLTIGRRGGYDAIADCDEAAMKSFVARSCGERAAIHRREISFRMFGELVPQGGGDPIPLLKKKLLIGRRDSCDIALRFPNVSSRHCELEMQDGYWLVRDLGSSNGTKVNGVRVRAKWILPGDEVAVAKHRFKIDYDVRPDAPPPPPLEEGDDNIMGMSLMEKAGLVHRRTTEVPLQPPRKSSPPAPRTGPGPRTEDDQALEWLQDDDR